MPVTHVSSSSWASGTGAVTPPMPSLTAPGDLVVVSLHSKYDDAALASLPSGWTDLGAAVNSGRPTGTDNGNTRTRSMWRIYDGVWTMPSLSPANNNVSAAKASTYRAAGYDLLAHMGVDDGNGSPMAPASTEPFPLQAGDMVHVDQCINGDVATWGTSIITATGGSSPSMGTMQSNVPDGSTTSGTDMRFRSIRRPMNSGTSTHLTVSTPLSGTITNAVGTGLVLRIREVIPSTPSTGSASGAYAFSGTGTGKRTPKGSATGAYAFTGAATGARTSRGSATGGFAYTGTAVGSVPRRGTATGGWAFTGSATGKKVSKGSAVGSYFFPFVGAVGDVDRKGAATGAYQFTGTAVGDAPYIPPNEGSASGGWSFTGTAVGSRPRSGSASGSWAFSGSATGTRTPKATGSGSYAWTGTATGRRLPRATATGGYQFTGTATGTQPRRGSASGGWSFTGSAVGQRVPRAVASGGYLFAFLGASGGTDRRGASAGAYQFTGAAVGTAPLVGVKDGSASGAYQFTGGGVGRRESRGSAVGSYAFAGSSTGQRAPKASASGSHAWAGTAVGWVQRKGVAFGRFTFGEAPVVVGRRTPNGWAVGQWSFVGEAVGVARDADVEVLVDGQWREAQILGVGHDGELVRAEWWVNGERVRSG